MNTCPVRNNCANYFDDNACKLCEHRSGERPTNFRPIYEWRHCEICQKKQFEADLKAAGEKIMSAEPSKYQYFFTSGTGVPDEFAIAYFEATSNIVVVDRKGNMWRQGKPFAE